MVYPRPASLADRRGTLCTLAPIKQLVLLHRILPPPPLLAVFAPQNSPAPPLSANIPRSLCPRCQKGYHWAKECRSQFRRNGAFSGPDQHSGNELRGHPQAPTTTGATALDPFIPFVPSQNSSEQPQAVQDWTSVPPPQQY